MSKPKNTEARHCDYRATFMIEGREIPGVLEKWLFDALPVDFTVKFSRRREALRPTEGDPASGLRVIEVTATASTPELLMEKVAALSRSLERAGVSLIALRSRGGDPLSRGGDPMGS